MDITLSNWVLSAIYQSLKKKMTDHIKDGYNGIKYES